MIVPTSAAPFEPVVAVLLLLLPHAVTASDNASATAVK
jgi:hypothetical protein